MSESGRLKTWGALTSGSTCGSITDSAFRGVDGTLVACDPNADCVGVEGSCDNLPSVELYVEAVGVEGPGDIGSSIDIASCVDCG